MSDSKARRASCSAASDTRRHLQVVAADGVALENTCHHQNGHLPLLEMLGLDDFDRLSLKMFRYICASLANDTSYGWEMACRVAGETLGFPRGLALANDLAMLVHAINEERICGFSYMDADCPTCSLRVCEDEEALLAVLDAARLSDRAALEDRARVLAGGADAVRIAASAAAMMGRVIPHPANKDILAH